MLNGDHATEGYGKGKSEERGYAPPVQSAKAKSKITEVHCIKTRILLKKYVHRSGYN